MTLTNNDRAKLAGVGFLLREIEAFADAVDPAGRPQPPIDLSSPVWLDMMKSRKAWQMDMIDKGFMPKQIIRAIEKLYERRYGFDAFAFLRAEYRPPKRITDYQAARQQRARAQVAKYRGEEVPPMLTEIPVDKRNYPYRPPYRGS